MRRIFIGTTLLLVILSIGCRRDDEIQTYRVSKETAPAMPVVAGGDMGPAATSREISWTTPKGWKELAPSSMRVGSFSTTGSNGQSVDISIIPLSGQAGGDLANINRWRGQINLPPLAQADLPKQTQTISPGGKSMLLVDFLGSKRLVAAIYKQDDRSWFFKMSGEDTAVKAAKPAFLKFLESVHFHHE